MITTSCSTFTILLYAISDDVVHWLHENLSSTVGLWTFSCPKSSRSAVTITTLDRLHGGFHLSELVSEMGRMFGFIEREFSTQNRTRMVNIVDNVPGWKVTLSSQHQFEKISRAILENEYSSMATAQAFLIHLKYNDLVQLICLVCWCLKCFRQLFFDSKQVSSWPLEHSMDCPEGSSASPRLLVHVMFHHVCIMLFSIFPHSLFHKWPKPTHGLWSVIFMLCRLYRP